MKYYKLFTANEFIGVVNSIDFVKINPTNGWLLTSDENQGQFVSYKNKLYRDFWMQPIENNRLNAITVNIREITKEEYDGLKEAINNNEPVVIDDDEPYEDEPVVEPDDEPDMIVEFMRASKRREMNNACHATIEAGFDLTLRNETRHFSLTTQDQLNLMSLSTMAQTQDLIPYHADGEECEFYTPQEINEIVAAANNFKNYQIAYNNSLKTYIDAQTTIEDVAAITYGTPIPDEYKSDVLRVLE